MSQAPESGSLGGRGRGRGPWREGMEFTELRRPRTVLPGVPGVGVAAAPGPAGDGPTVPSSARRPTSRLSADAKEFVPRGHACAPPADAGGGGDTSIMGETPVHLAENYLSTSIHDLTLNPGLYNSYVGDLSAFLLHDVEDTQLHQRIIDIVIEKSIMFPNFRYTGARLLCHFRGVLPPSAQHEFRNLILRRCQENNEQVMEKLSSGANTSDIQGFAMFLAELFMQLNVKVGETARIVILGSALLDTINRLLTTASVANVKCVCQVLKLAGMALDEQNLQSMDVVFEKLAMLQRKFTKEDVSILISSLEKLRQNAWRPPTVLPEGPLLNPSECPVEPSFYLNNGDMLSPEETQFLNDNVASSDDYVDECGEGAYESVTSLDTDDDDPEFGPEYEAALEEFLIYSKQKST